MALKQWSYDEQVKAMFFSPFYLSLFFFATVLFMLNLAKRTKTHLNLPPFPPKLPIIGNLHQLGELPHHSFRELSRKYGDMMMLQLGQRKNPTLVVSSAHVVMEMMKNHDLAFSNRPQMTSTKILLYGCKDVGFGNYGEDWRQKRRICVLELLSMKRVNSFHAIREEEAEELVNKLRVAASLRDDARSSVNLSEMLISTSSNIVCKCTLGRKFTAESESHHNRVNELARHVMIHITSFTVGDYFPLFGWVDVLRGKIQEYKATFEELDGLFDEVIEEHLVEGREKGKDFVDILLETQEDSMLHYEFTKTDLKALLMDMFVGATDTTAAALEWAMSELVRHPNTMKKVQEEVRKVVGQKPKIEENDVNQMHYLKCVVKETLRFHPPTALVPPRETITDVKLKGYDIPAKTMVHINAWAIQRDPEFWENPEEFMPERFENSPLDFKIQDFHFLPFGFGRRGCPGMNFGIAAVEYVLAILLYWFDWKLPEAADSHIQDNDIDMSEVFGLVVSRKVPLQLKPVPFSFSSAS